MIGALARLAPALDARLRPRPAVRYVHPRARSLLEREGDHDAALDVADDASPRYLRWIGDLCRAHLGRSVLEVGAGIGSITEQYAEGRRVLATDVSDACVEALQRRFAGWPNVSVARADLRTFEPAEHFESILMINVLEHIQDDVGALRSLRNHLQPRGRVVVYVPALNGLYGAWDLKVGHYRRYAAWRMRAVFDEAGYEPVELRYVNVLAIPAWVAFSRTNVDRTLGRGLSLWDRTGVPLGRALESCTRVPIGLNLLCVGQPRR